jgi:hypothetical protein
MKMGLGLMETKYLHKIYSVRVQAAAWRQVLVGEEETRRMVNANWASENFD